MIVGTTVSRQTLPHPARHAPHQAPYPGARRLVGMIGSLGLFAGQMASSAALTARHHGAAGARIERLQARDLRPGIARELRKQQAILEREVAELAQ
jgi:hypothetical protein